MGIYSARLDYFLNAKIKRLRERRIKAKTT
jgi:hypothetical protein